MCGFYPARNYMGYVNIFVLSFNYTLLQKRYINKYLTLKIILTDFYEPCLLITGHSSSLSYI